MNSDDVLYGAIRNGTLTLSGNAPSIKVESGMLVVRDGPHVWSGPGEAPPVEERMETLRLPRTGCPVKHIVATRPDGFCTFAAIEWLHQAGISLTQLDWHGNVLLAKAPAGPDRPAMRRQQALAAGSETGLAIMRELLRHKLAGEARVARLLGGEDAAALIERMRSEIAGADTGLHALASEGAAASAYWSLWADVAMRFARRDKVPDHWLAFGLRRSPIAGAGRPRHAASAPGAMLNYLYGLAVSQMAIALATAGLDPGIGVFHADKEGRASLAYDAIEAVRPYIEAWLLCCLAECRFAKRDFWEESDGTIRLTRPLSSWLALSAPLWRQAAEVGARWLADSFARFALIERHDSRVDDDVIEAAEIGRAIPLSARPRGPQSTGAERRVDVGHGALTNTGNRAALQPLPAPLPALPTPGRPYKPALAHEVMPRACHECGRALTPTKAGPPRKFCSAVCAAIYRSEMRKLTPIEEQTAEIAAIRAIETARSDKLRRHIDGRLAWDRGRGESNEAQLRQWYTVEVAPRLGLVARTEIVRAIGVSRVYARAIAGGKVPHPRHFAALATLAGVKAPEIPAT